MALLNMAPMISAVMPSKLTSLYGVDPSDANLLTLLQHRAVMLGLIGLALAVAAHRPELRWPSLILGVLSMGSFLVFALARGQMSGALGKIAYADLFGLAMAALAAFILLSQKA